VNEAVNRRDGSRLIGRVGAGEGELPWVPSTTSSFASWRLWSASTPAARVAYNPLGEGGTVWVRRGASAAEKRPLFRALLAEAGLPELIRRQCRIHGRVAGEPGVAIKTCFMLGTNAQDRSHIIDPELLEELAQFLHEHGSGRGALFLAEMDRKAFPPRGREPTLLRLGRRFTQSVPGLRLNS
jgi:hypothetical protein